MSKRDELTGRGPQFGNQRSKAMNATCKKWSCNLQSVKIRLPNGSTTRVRVSTRTMRTLRKKGQRA